MVEAIKWLGEVELRETEARRRKERKDRQLAWGAAIAGAGAALISLLAWLFPVHP